VPVYVFRCLTCGSEHETLRPLGDTTGVCCPECGGQTKLRLGRVAVRYNGWGFTSTDSLVSDPRNKNFRDIRDKAEQISDE
jgi:putative FmdB family regulatory protein